MRNFNLALALISTLALPLVATATDPQTPSSDMPSSTSRAPERGAQGRPGSPMFQQLDTNHDGYVDGKEAARSASVQAEFKSLDKDGDGRISAAEWAEFEGSGK